MEKLDCQVLVENIQVPLTGKEPDESQNEDNSTLMTTTTTTTTVATTNLRRGRPKKSTLDKKPLICEICDRVLSSTTKLIIHKRTHTGEKPFSCPHCDVRFARKDKLTIHIRCHTGEKPHTCYICFKSFVVGHKLKIHMKTSHDGIKPFTCPHCSSKFSRKDKLQLHIQTHSGVKPFVCPYCPIAKFTRKDKLIAHIKFHHPEDVIPTEFLQIVYKNSKTDSEAGGGKDDKAIKDADESLREKSDLNKVPNHEANLPSENNPNHVEFNENSLVPMKPQSISSNAISPLVRSSGKNTRSSSKIHKCHVCKLLFSTEMVLAKHLFKAH